jgi:hypothetical protein
MDGPVPADELCEQCGLCSRIFCPGIPPIAANVYLWIGQGLTDILCWVVVFMEDGRTVPCPGLSSGEPGNGVSFHLCHADNGEYVAAARSCAMWQKSNTSAGPIS